MKIKILKPIKQTDKATQRCFLKPTHNKLTRLDLFFKWAPLAGLFVLDALDEHRAEKFEKHLLDLAGAALLLNAAVLPLKYICGRKRPNGKSQSFPSRHTATSFLGSELLRQEYKEKYPAISNGGYLLSAATGALRLYHNKHWLSDVLIGAVIGVAAVKLSPKLIDEVIKHIDVQPAVY